MKNILVPTDFSLQAENALKVAAQLAKKYGSEIYLLHTLEFPLQEIDAFSHYSDLPEAMFFMKLAHKHFKEVLDKPFLKGITIHETIQTNNVFKGVLDTCKEHDINLIVMGSHGASGFKEMFIGSNTEKVVRLSKVPVLVIKNKHKSFIVNDFVFASDFKLESYNTYQQATELAKLFDAKLHLLMINTVNNFTTSSKAKAQILNFIKGHSFDNYTLNIYNDNSIEKGILNFSKDINADLIGISTHGRQGLSHFLNGSISEDLVNHAQRPVITFKI